MRQIAPFQPDDLAALGRFLSAADRVVTMLDIWMGHDSAGVIGLRHDVDDNADSLDTALRMAEWEHELGIRSTYYLLHDSHYWQDAGKAARRLAELRHEVGLHNNAIAEAVRQRRHPHAIVTDALHMLREHVMVVGTVAHGDGLCHEHGFVNDELWVECPRPAYGDPDRLAGHVRIEPVSMSEFGLVYDANWLPRGDYLSDSGGSWSQPFADIIENFGRRGQLHMLVHPDWWGEAFTEARAAA